MSWLYVPDTEASNSASNSLASALASSVTWRGKPSPAPTWSRRLQRAPWLTLLSGLTCPPSTVSRGVELWISSLLASRVSPSVKPASASGRKTLATFGQLSLALSETCSPGACSSKTCSCEATSNRSETFEQWASRCRTPSRVPPPSWVRDILGDESSFLPTLAASAYGNNRGGAAGRVGKVRPSLDRLLATPTARDHRSIRASEATHLRNSRPLSEQIGRLYRDDSRPLSLNPAFLEMLMGVPVGWTGHASSATASSRSRQPSPGSTSRSA